VRYYAIAELDIEDPGWVRDYVANVTPMVERHGGRYLARTAQVEQIEGEKAPAQIQMIIAWPSKPPQTSSTRARSIGPTAKRVAPARATSLC
jgi:uncharacterized protein (DUF1330 family)